MGRFIIKTFLLIFVFRLGGEENSFESTYLVLKNRSEVHASEVRSLLSKPAIRKTDFDSLKYNSIKSSSSFVSEIPNGIKPVKENDNSPIRIDEVKIDLPDSRKTKKIPSDNISNHKSDLEDAYNEIYATEGPSRQVGYYFGFNTGLSFPKDSSVKLNSSKLNYKADLGYHWGVHLGKDFGTVRAESAYGLQNFSSNLDASSSFNSVIHNFSFRCILEKELGEFFDLRTGLGFGVAIVRMDGDVDTSGTGFSYDFLIGMGLRLTDNWSIQGDYRYFLTAANDGYDRINSHLWILSACLDF